MKTIHLFVVSLLLTAFCGISAFAQVPSAQPATSGKIAVIYTGAFGDEKEGVKKYLNAVNAINAEFKPLNDELKTMNTKLQGLATEIENLRKLEESKPGTVNQKDYQAKVDEAEKIQRDIKFKQEEGKARFEKRQQAVLGPVLDDIYKAVRDFAKQKGFLMVLDGGKLIQAGILLDHDDKSDITKEFVTFYNARPATTAATTTTPK